MLRSKTFKVKQNVRSGNKKNNATTNNYFFSGVIVSQIVVGNCVVGKFNLIRSIILLLLRGVVVLVLFYGIVCLQNYLLLFGSLLF